jgi:hypothetical protein
VHRYAGSVIGDSKECWRHRCKTAEQAIAFAVDSGCEVQGVGIATVANANPFEVPGLWAIVFGNGGPSGWLRRLAFTPLTPEASPLRLRWKSSNPP